MLAQPVGRPEDHNWNFSGSSKVTAIVFDNFDVDVPYMVLVKVFVGAFKQKKVLEGAFYECSECCVSRNFVDTEMNIVLYSILITCNVAFTGCCMHSSISSHMGGVQRFQ